MTRTRRLALATLASLSLASLSLAGAAGARTLPHLKLKHAFPAKDTTLTTAPEAVKLWLSEPADLATSRIAVTDAAGATVALKPLTRGAQREDPLVGAFVRPPGSGAYTVTWKAMSKDGHVVSGSHAFRVQLAR